MSTRFGGPCGECPCRTVRDRDASRGRDTEMVKEPISSGLLIAGGGPHPGSVWSVTVAVVRGLTVRWRPTLSFTLPDARMTQTAEPHRCS